MNSNGEVVVVAPDKIKRCVQISDLENLRPGYIRCPDDNKRHHTLKHLNDEQKIKFQQKRKTAAKTVME